MAAARRDNFHLLTLFSHHPVISNWLICLLLKLCLHGICAWGIVCQGPCGEARGQLCQVSCLLLPFMVWRCMWGFRPVLQEPYLLSHLALTGCFYHRREWQLTCHSSVCRGHSALASVTSNPEGTAHWCTWQLSQGVKSHIFNSGCSPAWELSSFPLTSCWHQPATMGKVQYLCLCGQPPCASQS